MHGLSEIRISSIEPQFLSASDKHAITIHSGKPQKELFWPKKAQTANKRAT